MASQPISPVPDDRAVKRILTIDGGGIRGTFPAAFLANLEQDLGEPIGHYFDLISGTSTGGIIAIGLALGMRASDILKLYEEQGPAIFAQTRTGVAGWVDRRVSAARWLWKPKYSTQPLRDALHGALGDRKLGEARTRLVIPAWHPQTQGVYIFKTAHHPRLRTDYKELAIDAALATAAAPTYFAQHVTANDVGLADGGMFGEGFPLRPSLHLGLPLLRGHPQAVQKLIRLIRRRQHRDARLTPLASVARHRRHLLHGGC